MRSPRVRAVPTDCFFVAMGSTRSLSLIPSSRSIFRTRASPGVIVPDSSFAITLTFSLIFAPRSACFHPRASRARRILVGKSSASSSSPPSRREPLLDDGGHGGASDDGGHDLVPELRAARADGQDRTLDCDVPRPGHLGSAQFADQTIKPARIK